MRYLLLPLLAALALPTAANAGLNKEQRMEICARFWSNQITYKEAANKLDIKEPLSEAEGGYFSSPRKKKGSTYRYCSFYKQSD